MNLKDILNKFDDNPIEPTSSKGLLQSIERESDYDSFFNTFSDGVDADQDDTAFFSKDPYNSDYLDGSETELGNIDLNELRAYSQSWGDKTLKGAGRIGAKVLSEIAKMPGVLGGIGAGLYDEITGDPNANFMKTAFDNAWINTIQDFEDEVKEDVLPVYIRKAVKEGNLWDNITSMDFWATEGADGIGYIVSMLAPGAAINKFNLGSKLLGVNKLTKMASKSDEALNMLSEIGYTAKNADLATATLANTLFEAGAEAKSAMDSYRSGLEQRVGLPDGDPNKLSSEEFDELLQKESTVGRNVFLSNAAILLGPNAMMSKMLWGKPSNKVPNKLINPETGKLQKLEAPSLFSKDNFKLWGKNAGKGVVAEGFWEEGMQSTVENYFTHNPDKSLLDLVGGDLANAYADMISSTDGQKAIFLGAAFGGGMTAYGGIKENKNNRKVTNSLIDSANGRLSSFYDVLKEDIYVRNENGDVEYEDSRDENGEVISKPKIDSNKVIKKLQGLNIIEAMSATYDLAVEQGDTETIEQIQEQLTTDLIKPFLVNDELGIEVLRKHLETSNELAEIKEQDKTGTKEKFINDIISKAEYVKSEKVKFDNLGPSLIDPQNENATEQDKVDFYNKLASNFMDNKANKFYLNNKLDEKKQLIESIIEDEYGDNLEDMKAGDYFRETLDDERLKKLRADIKNIDKTLKSVKDLESKFWKQDQIQKSFDQYLKEKKQAEENEKRAQEVEDILNQINEAKNEDELDQIKSPFEDVNDIIGEAKSKKLIELQEQKDKQDSLTEQTNDDYNNQDESSKQDLIDYINNNFNVGEYINTEGMNVPDQFANSNFKIKAINKDGSVLLESENGEELLLNPEDLYNKFSNENNYSTEGSDIVESSQIDKNSGNVFEEKNQPRIIITDNKESGEKLDFIDDKALSFERNPINKVGQYKSIKVNQFEDSDKSKINSNVKKALDMYNKKDFSDINFLIDYLPIDINLADTISAPLETASKYEKYNEVFAKSSRQLRETIVKEIVNNKVDPSNIQVEIGGQWNGTLKIDNKDNIVPENNIINLYQFKNDIKNIKSEDFYMVDDTKTLINNKKDYFPTNRDLGKGEIYLKINMANGKPFPLKLNIKKLNNDQADILYELYKYRIDNINKGKSVLLTTLDKELIDKVKTQFSKELDLFRKNGKLFNDITIKDITDFLIWDGTKSFKSQIRFYDSKLLFGENSLSNEDFSKPENKELFKEFLINNKRHHIKFKRRSNEGLNSFNLENRNYLEYIIDNGILNTNAVVNEPTFQGRTTMYLNKKTVKVNNQLSKFNDNIKTTYRKNLLGSNKDLFNKLPNLNKNVVNLDTNEEFYIDKKGNKYKRVSTLKDSKPNTNQSNVYNAAKRGNIVDELIRLYFSPNSLTKEDFLKRGVGLVKVENKKKSNTTIELSNNYFDQLYNILEQYKNDFDNKGYTIYSNSNTLAGKLKSKGLFAGTMDLLVYDNINKEWIIMDIKTSTQDRGDYYNNVKVDKYGYVKKDQIQQNAYKELFYQKNGIYPSKLMIIPLTSPAIDSANSIYSEIKPSSHGLYLEVDSTKTIYELANIKDSVKKSDSLGIDLSQINESGLDEAGLDTGVDMGELFGELNLPKKEVKKTPKKVNKIYTPSKKDIALFTKQIKNKDYIRLEHNDKYYFLTKDSYFLTSKDGFEKDHKKIIDIIKKVNPALPTIAKFDIKSIEKVWNSRINSVSLQESKNEDKTSDKIDFNKINDATADNAIKVLLRSYPSNIKDMMGILNNKTTNQTKLKDLFEMLEAKGIAKNEIKTKCNL